eukprot:g3256.t1
MVEAGVAPDTVSYTTAISACAAAGQLEAAREVYKAMREAGVVPNRPTYASLLKACARNKRWREALELLEEMEAAGKEDPDLVPDTIIYNGVIDACRAGNRSKEAERVFRRMQQQQQQQQSLPAPDREDAQGGGHHRGGKNNFRSGFTVLGAEIQHVNGILDAVVDMEDPFEPTPLTYMARAFLDHQGAAGGHGQRQEGDQVSAAAGPGRLVAHPPSPLFSKLFCDPRASWDRPKPRLDLHDLSPGAAATALLWWLHHGPEAMLQLAAAGRGYQEVEEEEEEEEQEEQASEDPTGFVAAAWGPQGLLQGVADDRAGAVSRRINNTCNGGDDAWAEASGLPQSLAVVVGRGNRREGHQARHGRDARKIVSQIVAHAGGSFGDPLRGGGGGKKTGKQQKGNPGELTIQLWDRRTAASGGRSPWLTNLRLQTWHRFRLAVEEGVRR